VRAPPSPAKSAAASRSASASRWRGDERARGTGAHSAAVSAAWTSTGTDRCTGSRRLRAWDTAWRRWCGRTAAEETDSDIPVTGRSAPMSSRAAPEASWKPPMPSHEVGTSPLTASTGVLSARAAARAVVILRTPGPPMPKQTPRPAEARAWPAAMYAAPPSKAVTTVRSPSVPVIGSMKASLRPPGSMKQCVTPWSRIAAMM
jgi:hypothetical protein